jgi:hypothetical protein
MFNEGIIVKWYNDEAVLHPVQNEVHYIREFNYQWEDGYSSYFIAPQQAVRAGYVSISSRSTHVVIVKQDAIQAGQGIDLAFIKGLSAILSKRYRPVPHREGDSPWVNVLKDLGGDVNQPEPGEMGASQVPGLAQGSSNMQQVTKGMSVSKASGSWAYIVELGQGSSPDSAIRTILDAMRQAVQPLLDNDLIDFYEVVERAGGKRLEIKYSRAGDEREKGFMDEYSATMGYLKFLSKKYLNESAAARLWKTLEMGPEDRAIQPVERKVSFKKLEEFCKQYRSSDSFLYAFIFAMERFDAKKLEALNSLVSYADGLAAKWMTANPGSKSGNGPYFQGGAAQALLSLWDTEQKTEFGQLLWGALDDPKHLEYSAGYLGDVFQYDDFLAQVSSDAFDGLKARVGHILEEVVRGAFDVDDMGEESVGKIREKFADPRYRDASDYGYLSRFGTKVDVSPEVRRVLVAIAEGLEERRKRVEEERLKSRAAPVKKPRRRKS